MPLKMIHGKGLIAVAFVLYVENVATVNAVSFWSEFKKRSSFNGDKQNFKKKWFWKSPKLSTPSRPITSNDHEVSTQSNCQPKYSSSTCRPGVQGRPNPSTRNQILSAEDCCLQCTSCTDYKLVHTGRSKVAIDVRGGDVSGHESAVGAGAAALATATPYNISLNGWKILFQIILTTINVVFWLVPLKNKNFSENKLGLSLANAFSGGVFLSLAFGHFMPECIHGFEGYNEALPFMITLGGYLLIFFVEKVAFDTHALLDHDHDNDNDLSTGTENGQNHSNQNAKSISNGRGAVILLGALAVHSILEMTALGLSATFSDSAILTLSIALHQPAESIALLVAFLKSGLSEHEIIKYLSIFSTMGPIGVAIGMAVKEFANPIADATVLATVAGTFIYVGATEVIPEEWEESEHKWKKFFCLIAGIVSIFGITQYSMSLEGHHG